MNKMKEDIAKLKNQKNLQTEKMDELQDVNKQLENEVRERDRQLKKQAERIAELEIDLNDVCGENVARRNSGKVDVDPDNIVKDAFQTLMKQSRDWAYKWAKEDWSNTTDAELEKVIASLQDTSLETMASKAAIAGVARRRIRPRYLLNGICNHIVCYHTLLYPFDKFKVRLANAQKETWKNPVQQLFRLMQGSQYHLAQ